MSQSSRVHRSNFISKFHGAGHARILLILSLSQSTLPAIAGTHDVTPGIILTHHLEVVSEATETLQMVTGESLHPEGRNTLIAAVDNWLATDPDLATAAPESRREFTHLWAKGVLDQPLPADCSQVRARYNGAQKEWQWMRKVLTDLRLSLQRVPFCKCDYDRASLRFRESVARYKQWYPVAWHNKDYLVTYQWDTAEQLVERNRLIHPNLKLDSIKNFQVQEPAIAIGSARFEFPAFPPGFSLKTEVDGSIVRLEQEASVTDLCISRSAIAIQVEIAGEITYRPVPEAVEVLTRSIAAVPIVLYGLMEQ